MFDTLTYARTLKAAGFTEAQAEAQADALREAIAGAVATQQDLKDLATELRGEIKDLATGLRGEIKAIETSLHGEIKDLKAELLKWVIGIVFVQTGLIITLLKVL